MFHVRPGLTVSAQPRHRRLLRRALVLVAATIVLVPAGSNASPAAFAQMTNPAPGSTLTASMVAFQWTAGTGVSQYWLQVGTTAGAHDLFNQDCGTSLGAIVTGLSSGSTLYVRLWSLIGGAWQFNDYSYTATASTAEMTTPAPGSTLGASTVQFQWTGGTGVSQYWLHVGVTAGGKDLYNGNQRTNLNATVTGLSANGTPVYVRLWSLIGRNWLWKDYTYTSAAPSMTLAQMMTPAPQSTLAATTVLFQWTGGTGVSQYWLHVGVIAGGKDLYNQDQGSNLNATVTGLPATGGPVYVRLWSFIGGNWLWNDYTYTDTTPGTTLAQMITPAPLSTLAATTVQFQWTGGTGVSQYWLTMGTTPGGNNLYTQDQGTNLGASLTGLPIDGTTVYVRLWSLASGSWQYNDYSYTALH